MSKYFLFFSLLFNLLLAVGGFLLVQRLGGWRYILHRMQHTETGLYAHRRQLFERMAASEGAVIFLGDSQTEQCEWREWLRLPDSLPVLNRGITADHVRGIEARLPEVLRHRPVAVYLLVGINDLLFGRPPADILTDYDRLLREMRNLAPTTRIYVLNLPPVNNQVKRTGIENAEIRTFNAGLGRLTEAHGLPFLDLHTPLCDGAARLDVRFTEDGLHLNGAGYAVWKEVLGY